MYGKVQPAPPNWASVIRQPNSRCCSIRFSSDSALAITVIHWLLLSFRYIRIPEGEMSKPYRSRPRRLSTTSNAWAVARVAIFSRLSRVIQSASSPRRDAVKSGSVSSVSTSPYFSLAAGGRPHTGDPETD